MNALVINDNEYQVPTDVSISKWMEAAKVAGNPDSYISVLIDCPVEEVGLVPEETKALVMAFLIQTMFPSGAFARGIGVEFDSLSFGEFVDMEVYLDRGIDNHMDDAAAIIVKDFNPDMTMSQVWPVYKTYLNWRKALYYNYRNLFGSVDDDLSEEQQTNPSADAATMWFEIVMAVAQGDITRMDEITDMPTIRVLNWLAWNKQKQMELIKAQK